MTYELSAGGRLTPATSAGLTPTRLTDGVARWVRLTGLPREELATRISALDLPDDWLQLPRGADLGGGVVVHGRAMLVTLPVLKDGRRVGLRLICTPTTLITAEEEVLPAIDRVVADLCGQEGPAGVTLPGLLLDLLEAAARSSGAAYLSLRRSLDEFSAAIEEDRGQVPPGALLGLKRRVSQLALLIEEQSYCVTELPGRRSHIPQSDAAHSQIRDLITDADRGLKLLARLETRIRDLQQHELQRLQEATNRRLNVLTILSAIYMPATLVAGIYGMNFEHIPITGVRYGYLLVLSFMAMLVVGQSWYFYRQGWFK